MARRGAIQLLGFNTKPLLLSSSLGLKTRDQPFSGLKYSQPLYDYPKGTQSSSFLDIYSS